MRLGDGEGEVGDRTWWETDEMARGLLWFVEGSW